MTDDRTSAPNGLQAIDVVAVLVTLFGLGMAVWIYANGPTTPIPMHFDIKGQVDRWGDREEAGLVMGAINLVMAIVFGGIAWSLRNTPTSRSGRRGLWFAQMLVLIGMLFLTSLFSGLALGLISPVQDGAMIIGGVSLFIAALMLCLGAVLGKTTPNPWMGVRTPWNRQSRLAWDKSNRLLGRLWFWVGVVGVPASLFGPQPLTATVLVAALIASGILALFESWRVWAGDPDRKTA